MVRQGPVVSLSAGLVLALAAVAPGEPAGDAARPKAAPEAIDRRPYTIKVHVAIDPEARLDARRRDALLADWKMLVHRFVGAPWELAIAEGEGALAATAPERLAPDAFADEAEGVDKVWVIRIGREGARLGLTGRAFDTVTEVLGPIQHRVAPFLADLPRALLHFSIDLFTPSAEVGASSGGGVSLTVRGAALEASSPLGRVVAAGSVFRPLRIVPQPEGKARILNIPFTYLRVEGLEGPVARCAIVSALRDPLTRRFVRQSRLAAVGVKPGSGPTRLRFVTRTDQAPAAGYLLMMRTNPDAPPQEVGTTDREGRFVLQPGFADGLVLLRLLAGDVEPMVELPAMPGETAEELTIPFEPKPQAVALETQLDALRDEIIDLVAVRARLEARLKARSEDEDWAAVEAALQEFARLPARGGFADRLAQLKDGAAKQQAKAKVPILTKTAQAQLSEIQALIDRYLDDEVFRNYTEMLTQARTDAAKKGPRPAPKK